MVRMLPYGSKNPVTSFGGPCSGCETTGNRALLVANSPLQPSDTQIPFWSYPQFLPSMQAVVPVDRSRTTPSAVFAVQYVRSLLEDVHLTVTESDCCCATKQPAALTQSIADFP